MKKTLNRDCILLILDWCCNKFKKSKHRNVYPKLRVYKTSGMSITGFNDCGVRGTYCGGTITVYLKSIDSVLQLCETIIHEYKHYLLSEKEYEKIQTKYLKTGMTISEVTDIHPHEKKANNFEDKWGVICFNELRNKLYKK
jgi:hypothetical protein